MLLRYNTESTFPSYESSWIHSAGVLNPSKDTNDNHYMLDCPSSILLPRTKVATVQRHFTSTMFDSRKLFCSQAEYINDLHQRPINEYNENFRYNIPLQERFHQQNINSIEGV